MQDPNRIGNDTRSARDAELGDLGFDDVGFDDTGFDDLGFDDLARQDFADRLAWLKQGFQNRFGMPLTITGTDTAEHVRLHGRGLAADIRTHGLSPEHLDWLRDQANGLGLNGRDYSWLTRPVTTSTGVRLTGPHFHLDYGDHSDYGAVPALDQSAQRQGDPMPIGPGANDPTQSGRDYGTATQVDYRAQRRSGQSLMTTLPDSGHSQAGSEIDPMQPGRDYGAAPLVDHGAQSRSAQSLVATPPDSGRRQARDGQSQARTPAVSTLPGASAEGSTPPTACQIPARPRTRTLRGGNLASVTVTPESHGRVIEQNVAQAQSPNRVAQHSAVQTQSHPTRVQATSSADSIQIDASDLLNQLDGNQISPQQFYRAFQDRYAHRLEFSPAQQAATREYYRSLGSSYDPFSFAASPAELIGQTRNGKGFVTVGRSPEVIRNLEAFRHSAYIDPMTAQVRNAASPQADLDRAIRALIDKGIDPASVHWDGDLDPDSQLQIMASSRGAWPELQRYFDARSRLHPSTYQQLTMDIGSAATRVGSQLVQTAGNLGTLLFSRGEPTEPPEVIEA
jgi:hypothetical protein